MSVYLAHRSNFDELSGQYEEQDEVEDENYECCCDEGSKTDWSKRFYKLANRGK